MYTQSKYIVGIVKNTIFPAAIVFSDIIQHKEVAFLFEEGSITGAGFCSIKDDSIQVYGESISLKSKSHPDHAVLVARAVAHPSGIM